MPRGTPHHPHDSIVDSAIHSELQRCRRKRKTRQLLLHSCRTRCTWTGSSDILDLSKCRSDSPGVGPRVGQAFPRVAASGAGNVVLQWHSGGIARQAQVSASTSRRGAENAPDRVSGSFASPMPSMIRTIKFWTTLALWNRWRHDTFKDDRETELHFLDELPTNDGKGVVAVAAPAEVWSPRASRHTS